jgi:preprotein translocase subunit SecA
MYSLSLAKDIPRGSYPEQAASAAKSWERCLERVSTAYLPTLQASRFRTVQSQADAYGQELRGLDDDALQGELHLLRQALSSRRWELIALGRSFALIRELADRLLGQRHYDVQLFGGWIMLNGMVAEMGTGEGKTLTATLPACTMALAGVPVHIVTVNDYLAQRDARWMEPIYQACGLTVGIITHGMSPVERQQAYACDITYCTNKELVFDYLKDRLVFGCKPGEVQSPVNRLARNSESGLLMRGLSFAIVDEADSVLIDEARTPLVISGQGDGNYEAQLYRQAVELAGQLRQEDDFRLLEAAKEIRLTETGRLRLAQLVDGLEAIWNGQRRREELIIQALTALHLFHLDRDYLVRDGRVQIVDEFTGRVLSDRTWERGLHQMVEVKEGCRPTAEKDTLARISYQRFFRRYHQLAGMTGTGKEVSGELWSVYGLRVVAVPTNRPVQREILPSRLHVHREEKWQAVVERIAKVHACGRPVLVGTRSVEASEYLAKILTEQGLPHRLLNARQDEDEAEIIASAGERDQITVATNMAGRGTDIRLGPGIAELGGLHVIATEPHAARRIDRQLFGRCGRQGDKGSCELFASLEDEILAPHYSEGRLLAAFARRVVSRSGVGWCGRFLTQLAQRRMERRHFQIRAELLSFDEMMEQTLAFSGKRE